MPPSPGAAAVAASGSGTREPPHASQPRRRRRRGLRLLDLLCRIKNPSPPQHPGCLELPRVLGIRDGGLWRAPAAAGLGLLGEDCRRVVVLPENRCEEPLLWCRGWFLRRQLGLVFSLRDQAMSSLQVHDVEPRAFKAMLHFIYTDSLPEVVDDEDDDEVVMAQHLLVAADRYGLQRLKVMCEAVLLKHIDTSTVATTLTLAEQHDCEGLKEGCFRFMRYPGNTKAVMASEGFQHLRTSCPFLIEEMLAKLAP